MGYFMWRVNISTYNKNANIYEKAGNFRLHFMMMLAGNSKARSGSMKNFKAVLDILRENISFKLGMMVLVTLLTCFVSGLWILGVQRLVDVYGEWLHAGGNDQSGVQFEIGYE